MYALNYLKVTWLTEGVNQPANTDCHQTDSHLTLVERREGIQQSCLQEKEPESAKLQTIVNNKHTHTSDKSSNDGQPQGR